MTIKGIIDHKHTDFAAFGFSSFQTKYKIKPTIGRPAVKGSEQHAAILATSLGISSS